MYGASLNEGELTREKKVDMGENLLPQVTSTVNDFYCKYLFLVLFVFVVFAVFFFNSVRTGLYSFKAVGVIRKNTKFL